MTYPTKLPFDAPPRSRKPSDRRARSRTPSDRADEKTENRTSYLFLSPWLIGMVVFMAGPLVFSIFLSMTDWNLRSSPHWVGLDNYQHMVADDYRFWLSLKITATYLVISVPVYIVFGLFGAVLLNQKVWGIRMFRTILFLPSVLSGVAVAALWMQLLNPDLGVVNTILRALGVAHPPGWFSDPSWSVPALVVTNLWSIVGGGAIIYLAGLQNIDPSLYESAAVDGAGAFRRFWRITIPLLTPTLFFSLITTVIAAFQVFDTAFTIGGSGAGSSDSLLFYLLYVWQAGFRDGQLGYAAALSWVLFILGAVTVVLLMRTSEAWVFDENVQR